MEKLIAIWNVFDGEELLPYSVNAIKEHVDVRIAVLQSISNRGNEYTPSFNHSLFDYVLTFEPDLKKSPMQNETDKRNLGINFAKQLEGSHYILLDCDEVYISREFSRLKKLLANCEYSCVKMYTYYGNPTQRIEPIESYYVPFINKLKATTKVGNNRSYPVLCDPTRKDMTLKHHKDILVLNEPYMHHFSWVRRNLKRKFENSTSEQYFHNADEVVSYVEAGKLVHFEGKLIEVENIFGIEI